MPESEEILLQRFVSTGDAEAFSEIVHRYAGLVYGACLRVLEDQAAAADAAQETFYQLLRSAGSITGSVPAWLHKVATRKAIDAIRSDSSRKRREAQYMADKPREAMKWEDISLYVDEELSELDEQTKNILIQHFFEGRTVTDIAAGQELSQPTISRRIESGLEKLRGKLRKRGIIVAVVTMTGLLTENAVQAAPAAVLQELGKMAIVGGPAAAASGATTAAAATSATAAKAAAGGVLSTITGKVVTAAAVTVVGVGSVVTYNEVTRPAEQPVREISRSVEQRQPRTTSRAIQSSPPTESTSRTVASPQHIAERDYLKLEDFLGADSAEPAATVREQRSSGAARAGGYGYGGGGAYGGSAYAAGAQKAEQSEEPNDVDDSSEETQVRYGGYGGGMRRRRANP